MKDIYVPEVAVEEVPKFILEDLESYECEMGYRKRSDGSLELIEISLVYRNGRSN